MEESWNFEIFWNFWKSHGKRVTSWSLVWNFVIWSRKIMEFCRHDFVATLYKEILFKVRIQFKLVPDGDARWQVLFWTNPIM